MLEFAEQMSEPTKYSSYEKGRLCSVVGCGHSAEYELYLYDYYPAQNEEFYEQDFTCPFLCSGHMEENEQKASGEKRPRGFVDYPFSNRHRAQGYTKYAPLADVYPVLFSALTGSANPLLIGCIATINDELIRYLAKNPDRLHELHPRQFEELVAELLRAQGFDPTLTPQTRDGGCDILAARSDVLGNLLYVIECKRYAPNRKVGVEVIRAIHGVAQAKGATKGIIVTTSSFTKEAIAFASPLKYSIGLHSRQALELWLKDYQN